MKQSSVEWLIKELEKHHVKIDLKNTVAFNTAKAMHKEQYIDAWMNGQNDSGYSQKELRQMAEEDYNQTYGE